MPFEVTNGYTKLMIYTADDFNTKKDIIEFFREHIRCADMQHRYTSDVLHGVCNGECKNGLDATIGTKDEVRPCDHLEKTWEKIASIVSVSEFENMIDLDIFGIRNTSMNYDDVRREFIQALKEAFQRLRVKSGEENDG